MVPPAEPTPPEAGEDIDRSVEGEQPTLPDLDYYEAVQGYLHQFGKLPDAGQFGLFLAQYGVVDPVTGGVLPEAQLRPVLQVFKMARHSAGDPATAEAPGEGAAERTAPDVAGEPVTRGGGVPQQSTFDVPAPLSQEGPAGAPGSRDSSAAGAGSGAVLVPAQQIDESGPDPVEQQIVTVVRWLTEAQGTGGRLTGAEVARRLGLSPKTGQRRVKAAAERLDAQRRQQGRAHLRSVNG